MNAITEAPNGALMSFIERAARDPEFDVTKFALLLDKQQEMLHERSRQEFNAAMAKVEADIGPVLRDRVNPAVNRKYATLEAINTVARPVYAKHGFSVRFGCDKPPKEGWMRVTCTVSHAGGYSEQNYLDSPVDVQQGARARTPVQAVGSTITYLRRYLLQMAFNIVLADDETDDDGETARTTLDRQADRAYSPREAINAAVPMPEPQRMTLRAWMDEFERDAAAATTPEEADAILKRESVLKLDDPDLKINEAVRRRALAIRAALVARIWPEAPEDDDLPDVEIAGAENVGAG